MVVDTSPDKSVEIFSQAIFYICFNKESTQSASNVLYVQK